MTKPAFGAGDKGQPMYAAIDVPAYAFGEPIVLAVLKHVDPEARKLIALTENEARWLYGEGRLTGWEPA